MKHLWILLICICCTLSVFGQHQNTDSTPPAKRTSIKTGIGDTGRAGKAVTGKNQSGSTPQAADTDKPVQTRAVKAGTQTRGASTQNTVSKSSADSSRPGNSTRSSGSALNGESTKSGLDSNEKLSPQQLQARQKAFALKQIKETKDSIYRAHKRQILSGLANTALTADPKRPDYRLYFPAYFYANAHAGDSNGGMVRFHAYNNRDLLFYAFIGITFLLALIKVIFPRYFNQVFWFFLHPNDRKNNVSEQISGQNVLPSLLLNLFFVLTGGLFLAQVIRPNLPGANFWTSWVLFTLLLTGVYLVKFLVILLSGWVFDAPAAATIYNQVVFSINKIIGLVLLPATLLISYGTNSTIGHVFFTVVIIISILLIYRYIASFLLIKGKLKVSAFHFILYLCAVEIIPLLLVYKVLLTNMGRFM